MSVAAITGALDNQLRILRALMLREVRSRYGSLKLGYLWAFVTPIFQVCILYLVWIMLRDKSHTLPLVLFLITGVMPFWVFRQVMRASISGATDKPRLLVVPAITLFDVLYSRVILETLTMGLAFFLLVFATNYLGEEPRIQDLLGVLLSLGLLATFGFGVGMLVAGLRPLFPSVRRIVQPLLGRPLFFTSGLFFTADMIPEPMRTYLLYNPLLHVIEYLRSGFFAEFSSPYYDLEYACAFALVLLAVGFATLRVNAHRILSS